MRPRKGEEGAALLAVLLLVVVMSAMAAAALEQLSASTRVAANSAAADQARASAVGAEGLALLRVGDVAGLDSLRTTNAGEWNNVPRRLPLPGGLATAVVRDGGNCFNLNSVVSGDPRTELGVRPEGVEQFISLMRLLGIGPNDAELVAWSLADWIDSNSVESPMGAEDGTYQARSVAQLPANTLLAERSELRTVNGVTPEIYDQLRPWVCALPVADLSPINPNTLLPGQAILLAMLAPNEIPPSRASEIIAQRPLDGWSSVLTFWQTLAPQGIPIHPDVRGQLQIKTRWFGLQLDVELAGAQVTQTALIDAGVPPARVVARRWGEEE